MAEADKRMKYFHLCLPYGFDRYVGNFATCRNCNNCLTLLLCRIKRPENFMTAFDPTLVPYKKLENSSIRQQFASG